jgi:hypothetical protein
VSKRSIAVLPFDSLSDNKRDTYVADGIQDEILSNLAKAASQDQISQLINTAGNVMLGPIGTSIGSTVSKPAAR